MRNTVHWSYWLIAIVTLIWNAMGAMNLGMQMSPEAMAGFPENHRAVIEARPIWATVGFGIGVIAGTLGCILLLLRKRIAVPVFIVSLLGILVTMSHVVSLGIGDIGFSGFEIFMTIVMPVALAVFLIWYAKKAVTNRWIN